MVVDITEEVDYVGLCIVLFKELHSHYIPPRRKTFNHDMRLVAWSEASGAQGGGGRFDGSVGSS
jgi:hypothetical protein